MIINYQISTCVNTGALNEDNLYTEIEGTITEDHPTIPSESEDEGIPAGKIIAYYLDISAAEENQVNLWDLFDATGRSQTGLLSYYDAIYDTEMVSDRDFWENGMGKNILVIDEVDIDPLFPDPKTRLTAVWETIRKFGHGCSLVLLEPFPSNAGQLSEMEIQAAINEQITQYQRLGFKGPIGSGILYLNQCFQLPTAAEAGL